MLTKGYVTVQDLDIRWTDQEICDYYDTHPNLLISELAKLSGWSEAYIKRTLMGDDWND
jgi:hypothetical protein